MLNNLPIECDYAFLEESGYMHMMDSQNHQLSKYVHGVECIIFL